MGRAVYVNDCHVWHAGSAYTSDRILEGLRVNGYESIKVWQNFGRMPTDSDVERDAKWLGRSGVVVLNGEGTLHDDQPCGRAWLRYCDGMAERGCRVYLVNSIWCRQGREARRVLDGFSGVYFRDGMSRESAGVGEVRLDLTLRLSLRRYVFPWFDRKVYRAPDGRVNARGNIYGGGKWSRSFDDSHLAMESLPLRGYKGSFADYVNHLNEQVYTLFTGEYHGMLAAVLAGVNWVAVPAPTHKIEAFDRMCAEAMGLEPQRPPIVGKHYHRDAIQYIRELDFKEMLS